MTLMMSDTSQVSEFLNTASVMVIEPNSNYRQTIQRYLKNLKVKNVKYFDTVSEAEASLRLTVCSLMIVEWQQKSKNGLKFCRELRKKNKFKNIPFLLMSVESLRGDVVLASEVGVDGFLLKPFSYEDFVDQLQRVEKAAIDRVKFNELLDRAEGLCDSGDYEKAEALYLECDNFNISSARVQCGLGMTCKLQGHDEEAINQFKQAIESNPTYLESYKQILEIYEDLGQAHHILHYALKVHEISPDNPRYILLIAKAYLMIGQLKESEDFFRKTIRISPKLAEGHKGLGDVHLLQEDFDKAMNCYQKALDLDGDDVSILNSMGLVYVKQDQYQAGIKKYMLALNIEPDNAKVLFNIGYGHEKLCDLDVARGYYNRALISNPDYEKPLRGIERLKRTA